MSHPTLTKLCTLKEKLDALRAEFEDMSSEILYADGNIDLVKGTDNSVLDDLCEEIAAELEAKYNELEEALTPDDSDDVQTYIVHMWNEQTYIVHMWNEYEKVEIEATSPEQAEEFAREEYNFDHYEVQE